MDPGHRIKLLRTAMGVQQDELANKLGISRSYLSQIEKGKKEPSLKILKRIAEYFEMPPALLVESKSENNSALNVELEKIFIDLLKSAIAIRSQKSSA